MNTIWGKGYSFTIIIHTVPVIDWSSINKTKFLVDAHLFLLQNYKIQNTRLKPFRSLSDAIFYPFV
uniref:Uncharacterized protein n=1 Tax=Anguilla anguilla TaxID=7936 RepID=A0A0E9PVW0_ANGAN